MTGNELAEVLAAAHGLTKADAKKYVDTVFAAIGDAAAKGDEISLAGFGKFATRRHPSARAAIPLPARR